MAKNPPTNAGDVKTQPQFLGREDPQEEGMATHSSILAWRIPLDRGAWRLQFLGSQRIGHIEHAGYSLPAPASPYCNLKLQETWLPQSGRSSLLGENSFSFSATLSCLSSSLPTPSPQKILVCQTFLPSITQKPPSSF